MKCHELRLVSALKSRMCWRSPGKMRRWRKRRANVAGNVGGTARDIIPKWQDWGEWNLKIFLDGSIILKHYETSNFDRNVHGNLEVSESFKFCVSISVKCKCCPKDQTGSISSQLWTQMWHCEHLFAWEVSIGTGSPSLHHCEYLQIAVYVSIEIGCFIMFQYNCPI